MASRIPSRVRQLIIEFSSDPRRGEVARFCREHQISVAAFYKIRAVARADGPEAALLARSTAAQSTRRTEPGLDGLFGASRHDVPARCISRPGVRAQVDTAPDLYEIA
jgi:hypothetical protein